MIYIDGGYIYWSPIMSDGTTGTATNPGMLLLASSSLHETNTRP